MNAYERTALPDDNNAISFYETEPFHYDNPFIGSTLYPTYMKKDNKNYFVFNRRFPDDSWKLDHQKEMLDMLRKNHGKYCVFHSHFTDPKELLYMICNRRQHFEGMKFDEITDVKGSEPFYDFHGNLKEVSAAFFIAFMIKIWRTS